MVAEDGCRFRTLSSYISSKAIQRDHSRKPSLDKELTYLNYLYLDKLDTGDRGYECRTAI